MRSLEEETPINMWSTSQWVLQFLL